MEGPEDADRQLPDIGADARFDRLDSLAVEEGGELVIGKGRAEGDDAVERLVPDEFDLILADLSGQGGLFGPGQKGVAVDKDPDQGHDHDAQ